MQQTDELFVLVKSLTRVEKGYVKKQLSSGIDREGDLMCQLFDAISRQEEYDEPKLKETFSQGKSRSHFAVTKHNLYNKVLLALARFHGKSSHFSRLFDTIRCAEVLSYKGRPEAALELLASLSAELAENGGREEELLLVARIRNRILGISRFHFKEVEPRHAEIRQTQNALKSVSKTHELWELFVEVEHAGFNTGLRMEPSLKTQMEAWLDSPLLHTAPENLSHEARILRLETLVRLKYYLLKQDELEHHVEDLLKEMEATAADGEQNWQRNLFACSFMLGVHVQQRRFANALEWNLRCSRILEGEHVPADMKARFSRGVFDQEILCYCRLGLVDDLMRKVTQVTGPQGTFATKLKTQGFYTMYPNLIWAHFLVGDGAKVKACFRELTASPYQDWLFDFVQKSRVILMCTVADEGDTDHLHSLAEAYRKFIMAKKELNLFDKAVIKFFKAFVPNDRARFAQFAAQMEHLETEEEPSQVLGIYFFPLRLWAEAHARGISFAARCAQEHSPAPHDLLAALRMAAVPRFAAVPAT